MKMMLIAIRRSVIKKWYLLVWVLFAVVMICLPAFSFEMDKYRSGMSADDAKLLIKKQNYEKVETIGDYVKAWDTNGSKPFISLRFCKGRLVSIQKNIQPSFEYFVRLIDEKRKELGRPLDAWSAPFNPNALTESSGITFVWRDVSDFVTILYTQYSRNNELHVIHEVGNECYRVPY